MNEVECSCAGIYMHFPFCESICPYCDFYSILIGGYKIPDFVDALIYESRKRAGSNFGAFTYDSIYLGGGTPSLINPAEIKRLMENLHANFKISANAEITIECNPSSLTEEKAAGYLRHEINRVSLGVQSFSKGNLKTLGRIHSPDKALNSYRIIKGAGFKNVSLDLIYGIPGQAIANWEEDLEAAVNLAPEHISAYNLIIESGTEFGELYRQGKMNLPFDEDQGQMYELLNSRLRNSGYVRYEISNFSSHGFECRHNLKYWTGKPYLGLGPSAVSFDGRIRYRNESDIHSYLDCFHSRIDFPCETENIDRETALKESIICGLRLANGISLKFLKDRFEYDLLGDKKDIIDSLISEKMVAIENGRLKLTDRALFISDSVMVKLI